MPLIAAIHQPNFFPWLGYFDKIAQADAFIFLDDVQFSKTGGTWTNRVKLLVSGEPNWVTAPIERNYSGVKMINEMNYNHTQPWREKVFRTIEMNYGRAPFYGEMIEVVGQLIMLPENNIARFNCQAITKISGLLGLNTKRFHWSSNLPHKGSSNELLACLTRAVGAESYMYGGGADGYQDEQVFTTQGIRIIAQDFKHPVYQQARQNQFHAGLSVIDAVANLGWSATGRLLGTSK